MWEVSTSPSAGAPGSVVVLRDTLTDLVSFACQHQESRFVFSAVVGTTNRLLSLVRHARPHTKRLVQQFFSCGFSKRNVPPGPYKQCATPREEDANYLGLHVDRRLTWHKHILPKRKQLEITLTKMYWLLGRESKLSTNNKLLIYKTILKPIWT
jgi:hypothetical protein